MRDYWGNKFTEIERLKLEVQSLEFTEKQFRRMGDRVADCQADNVSKKLEERKLQLKCAMQEEELKQLRSRK